MNTYRKAHYTLRHRMIATLSQRLDGITYTQRHGLIRGMRRQGGLGFLPAILAGGDHETAEHRFLRSLDLSGKVVYEIGAFQGILTLFFSSRAKEVIAYEPNPPSYNRVMQNLRLNGRRNVRVRHLAVGAQPGSITLLSDPLMPGGTSGDPTVAVRSRFFVDRNRREGAGGHDRRGHRRGAAPPPELIKIERRHGAAGAPGNGRHLTRHRPDLYMEMHGATMDHKDANVRAIVDFVLSIGYSEILHVESSERIAAANATRGREGPCSAAGSLTAASDPCRCSDAPLVPFTRSICHRTAERQEVRLVELRTPVLPGGSRSVYEALERWPTSISHSRASLRNRSGRWWGGAFHHSPRGRMAAVRPLRECGSMGGRETPSLCPEVELLQGWPASTTRSSRGLPMGLEYYDRIAFINRDRMTRYLESGLVSPRPARRSATETRPARFGTHRRGRRPSRPRTRSRPRTYVRTTYSPESSLHLAGEDIIRTLVDAEFNVS